MASPYFLIRVILAIYLVVGLNSREYFADQLDEIQSQLNELQALFDDDLDVEDEEKWGGDL